MKTGQKMNSYCKKEIVEKFDKIGLTVGDTVLVFSDLFKIGRINDIENKRDFCEFYLNLIKNRIGKSGNIIVPTYTPDVARYGNKFDTYFSRSQCGILSEYVRNMSIATRSDHPLNSIAAIGPDNDYFCKNLSTTNFGWNSPFHRMHKAEIKVISVGLCPGASLGIAHYIEAMCCLPYVYNKLLKWSSHTKGKKDNRDFFATVRHLQLSYRLNYTKWAIFLSQQEQFHVTNCGNGYLGKTNFSDAFDVAAQNLKSNPYFLLDKVPNFIFGELPYDGQSSEQEAAQDKKKSGLDNSRTTYDYYIDPEALNKML